MEVSAQGVNYAVKHKSRKKVFRSVVVFFTDEENLSFLESLMKVLVCVQL